MIWFVLVGNGEVIRSNEDRSIRIGACRADGGVACKPTREQYW